MHSTATRLLAVACATSAVVVQCSSSASASSVRCDDTNYVLITDIGFPVSRCTNCFDGTKHPVAVTATPLINNYVEPQMVWKKCLTPDNKVMIKSPETNKYLARCEICYANATEMDSSFVFGDDSYSMAQWTMETIRKQDKIDIVAFKGDNGKYLARCDGCVLKQAKQVPQHALFAHVTSSQASYAQFRMVPAESIVRRGAIMELRFKN